MTKIIVLSDHECRSGLDRVRYAELLIRQLPEDHEGRNTWLSNYGNGGRFDHLKHSSENSEDNTNMDTQEEEDEQ